MQVWNNKTKRRNNYRVNVFLFQLMIHETIKNILDIGDKIIQNHGLVFKEWWIFISSAVYIIFQLRSYLIEI